MALAKKYYIHTHADGVLGDTKESDVRSAVDALAGAERGVLHFHGGLVDKKAGMETAERLQPEYEKAGAHPIFFVWESGFLETVTGNLKEIFREDIFEALLAKLMKWVVGDAISGPGAKAVGQMQFPPDLELSDELSKRDQGEEPYAALDVPEDLADLSDAQLQAFQRELSSDPDFDAAARALAAAARDTPEVRSTSRGVRGTVQKSTKTLMSPEIVDEIVDETQAGAKGLFSTAKLVIRAGKVLARVIGRLRSGHDHGPYTTVVEELLREFYVANVGAEIWLMMKKDTSDTFHPEPQGGRRGGELFLELLGEKARLGQLPPVDLIGHSTGAVFICNLLAAAHRAANDPGHPLPADFKFRNVAFLAPACSHTMLADTLDMHRDRFEELRVFAMNDEREAADHLLPGALAAFYPRSLLYFVSGVVERENGRSASDLPLVGMERYITRAGVYTDASVKEVRAFLAGSKRAVWAPSRGTPGLECDASDHGDLDNDSDTVASLKHMLTNGW